MAPALPGKRHGARIGDSRRHDTGRYRSADVGANIKEVASVIDVKQLRIEVAYPGYELTTPAVLPGKTDGIVEIDFKMRKVGAAAVEEVPQKGHARWTWLIPIALVIAVIGAAVRK